MSLQPSDDAWNILRQVAEENDWDASDLLELACKYINQQSSPEAFRAFVEEQVAFRKMS